MSNVNIRGADPRNTLVPGRVSIFFRKEGLLTPADWIDLGHVLEPNVSQEVERLDHFSNRRGERIKDRSLVTERSMRVSFRGDELNMENVRLAMGGSVAEADDNATVHDSKVVKNPGNPGTINIGATALAAVVVRSEGLELPVLYASPADYTVDLPTGVITISVGPGLLANAVTVPRVHIAWEKSVITQSFEMHDGQEIKGEAKFQLLGKGGERFQLHAKNVVVTVNGDINFGEGATWQEFPLTMEVLADEDGKMPKFHRLKEAQTF
jgi:hypothetical protein